ncbi:GNAT family N-acetyltransferase [Marinisporobacter balticus]|uniref:N-alpha-acetyltransferase 40 n=1 Tax=Marinisporobacter balticus TaxID=2018667 RepID=A0A4R2KEN9_9FIRM|nr:GNAT family N-acetyltransferase [Marinisporobacter balticus]TCO71484.1 ribosomal-protein-alanine N-acetyltransferase [Marinisporobacter balticus]
MYLKEVKRIPAKSINQSVKDTRNLKVYLVQDFNPPLLNQIVNFGLNIFGELGMDEWGLVPQIRHGNVFLLKRENKIIGLAILMRDWEDEKKCYLFDYAIAQDLQGRGLGYEFLLIICKELQKQGFEEICLTVDVENKPAIKLYQDKLGFKIVSFSKDEYGKDQDRYIMHLDLDQIEEVLGAAI